MGSKIAYEGLEGYSLISHKEFELLEAYFKSADYFLEIGTADGVTIGELHRRHPDVRYLCVDLYNLRFKNYPQRILNWRQNNPIPGNLFIGTFQDLAGFCKPETFDVIFVDGVHSEKGTYADLQLAMQFLTPNGTIVCHDYGRKPNDQFGYGATVAIQRWMDENPHWILRHHVDWLAVFHQ